MLQKFGFSQYESCLRSCRIKQRTIRCYNDCEAFWRAKSKIYEVLARLIDKGMVMDSVSRRKRCIQHYHSS